MISEIFGILVLLSFGVILVFAFAVFFDFNLKKSNRKSREDAMKVQSSEQGSPHEY